MSRYWIAIDWGTTNFRAAMMLSFRQTLEADVRLTHTAIDEHFRLFEAIRLRQVDEARACMRTILLNAAGKSIWQERPLRRSHSLISSILF